jgi:hypothetical protein
LLFATEKTLPTAWGLRPILPRGTNEGSDEQPHPTRFWDRGLQALRLLLSLVLSAPTGAHFQTQLNSSKPLIHTRSIPACRLCLLRPGKTVPDGAIGEVAIASLTFGLVFGATWYFKL